VVDKRSVYYLLTKLISDCSKFCAIDRGSGKFYLSIELQDFTERGKSSLHLALLQNWVVLKKEKKNNAKKVATLGH
jgi:hypothetical protein